MQRGDPAPGRPDPVGHLHKTAQSSQQAELGPCHPHATRPSGPPAHGGSSSGGGGAGMCFAVSKWTLVTCASPARKHTGPAQDLAAICPRNLPQSAHNPAEFNWPRRTCHGVDESHDHGLIEHVALDATALSHSACAHTLASSPSGELLSALLEAGAALHRHPWHQVIPQKGRHTQPRRLPSPTTCTTIKIKINK